MATKTESGIAFPAAAYALVPDAADPTGWKIRLWEDLDKKATAAQVTKAAGALAGLSPADKAKAAPKVKAAYTAANPGKPLPPALMMMSEGDDKGADAGDGGDKGDGSDAGDKAEGGSVARIVDRYLTRLKDLLKGKVPESDWKEAVAKARAHAGGMARAEVARQRAAGEPINLADLASALELSEGERIDDHTAARLFMELDPKAFATDTLPEWLPYMPTPGKHKHPDYGLVDITKERNERFVANMNNGVYQKRIPIDGEHKTKVSGAFAYIDTMRLNEDGSVDAHIDEWTDRGAAMVKAGRFSYFSPEWYDRWPEPFSEIEHDDVAIGGALTNRPFFKEAHLPSLLARQRAAAEGEGAGWKLFAADPPPADADAAIEYTFVQFTEEKEQPTMPTKEEIQAAEKAVTDSKAAAEKAAAELAKLTGKKADDTPAPADAGKSASEPTWKTIDPKAMGMSESAAAAFTAMRQAAEASMVESKAAREETTRIAAERRHDRFVAEVTGKSADNGTRWFGETAKHVEHLEALVAKGFDEDSDIFKGHVAGQRAAAEAIRQSELFTRAGIGGSASSTSAEGKLKAMAESLQKADPKLTPEKAMVEAMTRNPELYQAAERERREYVKAHAV